MKGHWVLAIGLFSTLAGAASPFTISASKIEAILSESKIHAKVFGAIESIVFRKHVGDTSTFQILTEGRGLKPIACLLVVDVTAVDPDSIAPKWEVTSIDDSACPK